MVSVGSSRDEGAGPAHGPEPPGVALRGMSYSPATAEKHGAEVAPPWFPSGLAAGCLSQDALERRYENALFIT